MSDKRRGLGRGLGALIPSGAAPVTRPAGDRPVDVFFPDRDGEGGQPGAEAAERELATSVVGRPAGAPPFGGLPGRGGAVAAPRPHLAPSTSPTYPGDAPAPVGPSPVADRAPAARLAPMAPAAPVVPAPPVVPVPPHAAAPAPVSAPVSAPVEPGLADLGDPAPGPGPRPAAESAGEVPREDDGTGLVPVPGAYFAELAVSAIRPNPKQPRQVFDDEALAELVQSVTEIGVLQPVVVRRVENSEDGEAQFELIMGERRLRACKEAGLETIPAIVRDTQDDELLRDALLENLHRANLNPLEEAAAYQQLLDDFGCTHEELATRIGRSRPQISNTLRLLKLPPLVQRRVAAGVLSAGHARALLGLEDGAAMERLAQRIVAEGLSVRAVEEIVALGDGTVAKAPKRRARAGTHTSELDDLAARLGDRLDTKVAIALGRNKGKVSIEFASVEDLNRIIELLSPEVRGAFRQG